MEQDTVKLSEFLTRRWFGATVGPSPSIASATGLYNQRTRAWDGTRTAGFGGLPSAGRVMTP